MRDETDMCDRMTIFCRNIFHGGVEKSLRDIFRNDDEKLSEEVDYFSVIVAGVSGLLGLILIFLRFRGQVIFNERDSKEIQFTPVAT